MVCSPPEEPGDEMLDAVLGDALWVTQSWSSPWSIEVLQTEESDVEANLVNAQSHMGSHVLAASAYLAATTCLDSSCVQF